MQIATIMRPRIRSNKENLIGELREKGVYADIS